MIKYIFKDFLDKQEIYEKNELFWTQLVSELLSSENILFDEYIATDDGFGNKFYDGNPICNFKIDKLNKAVRIIQEEPESGLIKLSARIEDAELSNGDIVQELSIHLELTTETIFLAIDLISEWVLCDLTAFRMKRYIDTVLGLKAKIADLEKAELAE